MSGATQRRTVKRDDVFRLALLLGQQVYKKFLYFVQTIMMWTTKNSEKR